MAATRPPVAQPRPLAGQTKLPKCQASPSGSGLLYDGDFQLVPDIGSHYLEYFRGEPFAPGWHVAKGSVDFNGSTGWGPAAPNNACTIDLDGIDPGGLRSRAFPTTPNIAYTVTFSMSGNGDCDPQNKVAEVEAAGQSARFTWDIANGNTAQNGDWRTQTWGFTATSTSTHLALISRDPRNAACGVVVGTISVTQG